MHVEKIEISQELLDAHPELVAAGLKVGDVVEAETLLNGGVQAGTETKAETEEDSELDAFSKGLKARVEAGEKLTREDIVRPEGWTAAVDTQFLGKPTEEEQREMEAVARKVGQPVISITKNEDGTYNAVGIDQSTYTNVRAN